MIVTRASGGHFILYNLPKIVAVNTFSFAISCDILKVTKKISENLHPNMQCSYVYIQCKLQFTPLI